MRQLLPLVFLVGCFSLRAQVYLDSLPFDLPANAQVPVTTQVAVGYDGYQDLRSANGAVTHLEVRQFNQGQINDWNQLWQAQIPGFTTTRPGSNPNESMDARIRGLRTLGFGSTQPLYVVDGVPGVDLFAVDPADIVAVDVLRDAASTAIYGGRGASGVVLISTKPAQIGSLKIGYQGQVSVESAAKRYSVLDEATFIGAGGTDLSPNLLVNTDWQDEVLQTAVGHAHHLSLNKGLGHGFLRAGLHYRDATGIVRESGFEQYNGSLLVGQRLWRDRLTLSAGATLGQRNSNYGFPEAYRYALTFNPSSPVRSDDPAYLSNGGYVENYYFDYFNPVALIEQNRNSGRTDFHLLHARAELAVIRNLTASVQVSGQTNATHNLEYYSPFSKFRGAGVAGDGRVSNAKTEQKNLEATLAYRVRKSGFQADLLGGYGWYHTGTTSAGLIATHLGDVNWKGKSWEQYRDVLKDLPEYPQPFTSSDYHAQYGRQLIAFFGRAQVQWRDTYFGTFSWRREGSSNLSPATRWGIFPSFSLGVDINKWLPIQHVDYLKVSVGHGVTGTETTQSGLYQRTFGPGAKFYYNGEFVPSMNIRQNPNDRLGWERTTENSLDLRFSLWSGRLQGAVDWYRYVSRDLILNMTVPVPPNFSANSIGNVGEVGGHGTELTLNYQLVKNQNFSWEVGLSAATAVNSLETAGPGQDTIPHAFPGFPCGCSAYYQILYPGVTIGTFWGAVATGIDANGNQTYEDINGNGQVEYDVFNRDQTKLGDAQPTWQLGLHQNLTWRNLDMSFQLQAVTGHQLVSYYRTAFEANALVDYNRVVTRYYDPALKLTRFNSRIVENASFLRMQYLSFGYRLMLNKKWINNLHFQIGAQNLFTVSRYTGLDPDLRLRDTGAIDNGSRGTTGYGDPLAPGIDRGGTYPTARRWWLGVEAAF